MNNADLYATANGQQRRDAEDVIKEYFHRIRWAKDGVDMILDIGCGDGDVTMNVLHKHLPKNYGKLLGVDQSSKMVNYASATHSCERVEFSVMDISCEVDNKLRGVFDHVFSFNCLQWIQDQRSTLKNIHSLLKPGGDCLLSFGARNHLYDIYKAIGNNPKWSSYMKGFMRYVSPFHFSDDPEGQFKSLMHEAGFNNIRIESQKKIFYYFGKKNLRDSVFAVNPFLESIPSNLHDEYFEDFMEVVRDLDLIDEDNNNIGDKITIRSPYLFLICHASK